MSYDLSYAVVVVRLYLRRKFIEKKMTIDSDWVQIMKGECPDSFTASPPFVPEAAYIDGMPLLMAAGTTRRWDDLVKRNFAGPVSRYFRMNAKTVILAFDDYKFVPEAKSITQVKSLIFNVCFITYI